MKTEGQKIGEHKTAGKKGTILRLGGLIMGFKLYVVGSVAESVVIELFFLYWAPLSGCSGGGNEAGRGEGIF